jgi:hypothetical protein
VLNFSAPRAAGGYANMSNAAGVATLPTAAGFLGIAYSVTWGECMALCFNTAGCAAWAAATAAVTSASVPNSTRRAAWPVAGFQTVWVRPPVPAEPAVWAPAIQWPMSAVEVKG